ncbi:biopolymer transport protein [Thioflavicoccus mobilis 8321]|uniref:Biopolymer transport protein n=1 Tax=Thioflavicoccus mobilis 8321 TaxID=765912 RepID=L0H0D0_9GAMM|nr:biopolymer transporter ExbD [Thioflavicoccus mobilis]AGA91507.1 biopolymer transport protein [Thioflavicoccus mobilis 8321]
MHVEPLARPRRGLRLAPLVDVVFLLLVFFMLVARLETPQAIAIDPPAAPGGTLAGTVLVRVDAAGRLDLNGTPTTLAGLPEALAPLRAHDPAPRVLVQPAPGLPLQGLVRVLDALAAAGIADPLLLERRAADDAGR